MGRSKHSVWITGGILACFLATNISAADLPCVQRAIKWPSIKPGNFVILSAVALNENGEGVYVSFSVGNRNCTRKPYADGTVSCLFTSSGLDARVGHPVGLGGDPSLPDWVHLTLDGVPSDNLAQVHLHQPNATYDFDPVCAGNFLVGVDQWGNRWTMAFRLRHN